MSHSSNSKLVEPTTWKQPTFLSNPLQYKLYLARHLPMALIAGIKPIELEFCRAVVRLPFTYLTKNPFKSIYFACLCMASELSTGVLGMSHIRNIPSKISMLVVNMKAEFIKKATTTTYFTCTDGALIANTINKAIERDEPQEITVCTQGCDAENNHIAVFTYTWSFKKVN